MATTTRYEIRKLGLVSFSLVGGLFGLISTAALFALAWAVEYTGGKMPLFAGMDTGLRSFATGTLAGGVAGVAQAGVLALAYNVLAPILGGFRVELAAVDAEETAPKG